MITASKQLATKGLELLGPRAQDVASKTVTVARELGSTAATWLDTNAGRLRARATPFVLTVADRAQELGTAAGQWLEFNVGKLRAQAMPTMLRAKDRAQELSVPVARWFEAKVAPVILRITGRAQELRAAVAKRFEPTIAKIQARIMDLVATVKPHVDPYLQKVQNFVADVMDKAAGKLGLERELFRHTCAMALYSGMLVFGLCWLAAICARRSRATVSDHMIHIPTPVDASPFKMQRSGKEPPSARRRRRSDSPAPTSDIRDAPTPLRTRNSGDDTKASENELVMQLNSMSIEELQSLPGIGEKSASQIVTYRDECGDIDSIEDLSAKVGLQKRMVTRLARERGIVV